MATVGFMATSFAQKANQLFDTDVTAQYDI
jgi:hypothetical protein